MIGNMALDYTEWAPPLYEEALRADLCSFEVNWRRSPTKIIMWVHQWEFLTKRYRAAEQAAWVIESAEVDDVGLYVIGRPAESSDGGRFMGVKVEVRDPKEHAPS